MYPPPQHLDVYHSHPRPAEGRGREGGTEGGGEGGKGVRGALSGQRVSILNRSPVVGKPLAAMLANDGP